MNWVSKKPKLSDNCVLVTATWMGKYWRYETYVLEWVNNGDGGYLGMHDTKYNECGDIDDLEADKYLVITEPV